MTSHLPRQALGNAAEAETLARPNPAIQALLQGCFCGRTAAVMSLSSLDTFKKHSETLRPVEFSAKHNMQPQMAVHVSLLYTARVLHKPK
jgi:hypothetical protein